MYLIVSVSVSSTSQLVAPQKLLKIDIRNQYFSYCVEFEKGYLIHIICAVYMPFYKSCNQKQIDEFITTVDVFQSIIDKYGMLAPIKICGDFNVQLPHKSVLSKTWFREKGFSLHSKILFNTLLHST